MQYNMESLFLVTNDIAFEVIKVNVTPPIRAVINEPDSSLMAIQVLHVPALTVHRLIAVTTLISDNLKYKQRLRSQKNI